MNFTGPNGSEPAAALTQGTDGNFYGTTSQGGVASHGTIFKMTPSGVLTPLHNFHGIDGQAPETPLVLGIDGNFYGTTSLGGTSGHGTFFKMTPEGSLTTLYNFNGADGSFPNTLLQGEDGNFYGTAKEGGANEVGSVFRITPSGRLTTLYNFAFDDAVGGKPTSLIQGANGNFYGTTYLGQVNPTLFEITPAGALTVICGLSGVGLPSGLIQSFDGNFFSFSENGGYDNTGSVFEVTASCQITGVDSFSFYAGYFPNFLMQTANGTFYGTTADSASAQGYQEFGTIFENPKNGGGLYYEYIFYTPTEGATPNSLVQGTDGTLYGTSLGGGTTGDGTVFNLAIGEGAFIRALPSAGPPERPS